MEERLIAMISPDRRLPQQQIYNFLRSLTIKYEPLAMYINDTLLKQGYRVNEQDRSSWKYYQNMVGQYHAADVKMYVTSLDTKETILFSPETLKIHPRTKSAYRPGGAYYSRLCDLYPNQVDLIKSIIFPVASIEKAILSEDLSLLSYGSDYLEAYEESVLVMKLETFLNVIKERWHFTFLDDEPYFHLTFWSSLWTQVAGFLMASRLEHVKTPYVHGTDLWNALKAEGLDDYSDVLNREKSMFLYQNIEYIKANAGKQKNLDILSDRLLRDLGIGLYGRIVVQESETGADAYQLTPQLVPVRIPVNQDTLPAPIEIKTVASVQSEILEKGLTDTDSAEMVVAVERKLGDTTLNEFATKFLEIRPVAQDKPFAGLINVFLMETLLVSIQQGYYNKPVEVREPLTHEPLFLLPKELLALYNYAVHKSMGLDIQTFPDTISLSHSFTPEIGLPNKTVPYEDGKLYLSHVVDSKHYLSDLHYDRFMETPKDFEIQTTRLWLRFMEHQLLDRGTIIDKERRAYEYLSSLCHQRREESIELVTGFDTYTDWLGPKGIDIASSILVQFDLQSDPKEQWANLADTIITTLIPINDTFKLFGNFTLSDSGYNRLKELFVQLCSYRVVFLQADRETSEYMPGSKWSTGYGPDKIDNYTDRLIATQVNTITHAELRKNLFLHHGIVEDAEMKSVNHTAYTVTTTVVDRHNTVHQKSDLVRPVAFASGTSMTHAPVAIYRQPIVPTINETVS